MLLIGNVDLGLSASSDECPVLASLSSFRFFDDESFSMLSFAFCLSGFGTMTLMAGEGPGPGVLLVAASAVSLATAFALTSLSYLLALWEGQLHSIKKLSGIVGTHAAPLLTTSHSLAT